MGAFLTCLAADTVCCVGSTACKCCFSVFGVAASTATRISYSLMFLFNSIIAWFMLSDWAMKLLKERFEKFPFYHIDCPEGIHSDINRLGYCYGTLAVYRVTFALVLFHLIFSVLLLGVKSSRDIRASIQNGFWGPKFVFYILSMVLAFYLPNGFFVIYGKISTLFSAFFILIQLILLIDLAYRISGKCLQEYENTDDQRWMSIAYLISSGSTLLMMVGFIVITGFLYAYFAGAECQLNQFFITFNLLLSIICWLASIHPAVQEANPQVGLPQASFVATYAIYLVFSAMSNEPNDKCNPLINNKDPRNANIIIGAIVTFIALAYSTSSTAMQGHNLMGSSDVGYEMIVDESAGGGDEFEDEEGGVNYSYSFFHFTFAVASMYVAMLLTNWDSIEKTDSSYTIGQSWTAVWVKIVTSWFALLLYTWTIIAPALMPDREFF